MKTSFFYILVLMALFACNRDKVIPEIENCEEGISYTDNIKDILDNSCAYSGCHVSGGAPGDFSNYSNMVASIDNGNLNKRMVELKDMPPQYASEGPTSLTSEELNLVKCWVLNNYAE